MLVSPMKIHCPCGAILRDSTDFLGDKAHRIADQDYFDWCDADGRSRSSFVSFLWRCPSCGRLALDLVDGDLAWFLPENDAAHRPVLQSKRGEAWRGLRRGHWRAGAGEVWWHTNVGRGFETPGTEQEVRRLYFVMFERLQTQQRLRSAFLRVDGEIVHCWEAPKQVLLTPP